MKPRGPLMIEHRLIEKMLKIAGKELEVIKKERKVDTVFINTIVDFIRTYADRTHHGKEEDILFKQLEKKKMNDGDAKRMKELVDDHILARSVVKDLVEENERYVGGDAAAIDVIAEKISFLIQFYPVHIDKEDGVFFPDTEKYFTAGELDAMLNDFREFDRKMIHEKYDKLHRELEKRYS